MTLFDEVFVAAQTKGAVAIQPNESDDKYLEEIIRVVATVDDPIWEGLSTAAKEWFNESVKAINLVQPIPEIDGFLRKGVEPKVKELKPNPPITAKTKTGASSILAPAPKKKDPNAVGVVEMARRLVIEHEDWTASQVYAHMIANGYADCKKDTVNVVASDLKKIIQLATSMGKWNINETIGSVPESVPETSTEI